MSRFTHLMCAACWNARNPDRPAPPEDETCREEEVCCFCGGPTRSGIYYHADPDRTRCAGTCGY